MIEDKTDGKLNELRDYVGEINKSNLILL